MKSSLFLTESKQERPVRYAKNRRRDFEKDIENTLGMEPEENMTEDVNKGFFNYLLQEKTKFTDFQKIEDHFREQVMEKRNKYNNNKVKIIEMKEEYKTILQTMESYMVTYFKFGSVTIDKYYGEQLSELRLEIKKKECELNSYNNLYKDLYKTNYLINKKYSDEITIENYNDFQYDKYKLLEDFAVTTTNRQTHLLNTLKSVQSETFEQHENERNEKMQKLNKLNMQIIEIKKDVMLMNREIDKVVSKQTEVIKKIKELRKINKKIKANNKSNKIDYFKELLKVNKICDMLNIDKITDIYSIVGKLNELNTGVHKQNCKFDIENKGIVKMYENIREISKDAKAAEEENSKEVCIDREGKDFDRIKNSITSMKGINKSIEEKLKKKRLLILHAFLKLASTIELISSLFYNLKREKEIAVKEELEQKRSLNPTFMKKKKNKITNVINYVNGEEYYYDQMNPFSLKQFYLLHPKFQEYFIVCNLIKDNSKTNQNTNENLPTTSNSNTATTSNSTEGNNGFLFNKRYILDLDIVNKFLYEKKIYLFFFKLFSQYTNNIYRFIDLLYINVFQPYDTEEKQQNGKNHKRKISEENSKEKEGKKNSPEKEDSIHSNSKGRKNIKNIKNSSMKSRGSKVPLLIYSLFDSPQEFPIIYQKLIEQADKSKEYKLKMIRKMWNEQKLILERDKENINKLKNNAGTNEIPTDDLLYAYMNFINNQQPKEKSTSKLNNTSSRSVGSKLSSPRQQKSTVNIRRSTINNLNSYKDALAKNMLKQHFQEKNKDLGELGEVKKLNRLYSLMKLNRNPYYYPSVLGANEEEDFEDDFDTYNIQKDNRNIINNSQKVSRNNKMLDMTDQEMAKIYFRKNEIRNLELQFFGDKKKNFFDTYTFHTLYYNFRTKKRAEKIEKKGEKRGEIGLPRIGKANESKEGENSRINTQQSKPNIGYSNYSQSLRNLTILNPNNTARTVNMSGGFYNSSIMTNNATTGNSNNKCYTSTTNNSSQFKSLQIGSK